MKREDVRTRLDTALARLVAQDAYLSTNNLLERCIAARLAMYLQHEFPEPHVDVEYNRDADTPKRLRLPDECANDVDEHGESLVVPDVIVHRRARIFSSWKSRKPPIKIPFIATACAFVLSGAVRL